MSTNFHNWYNEVLDHIKNTGLSVLSEYSPEGINIFSKFTNISRQRLNIKPFEYSDFRHRNEFNFLSMDLIYSISIMEILRPKINDLNNEGGTYIQTPEDNIYLRYAGTAFQTVYAYWDRIGDFLDLYFDTKQKNDVYLNQVFERFPNEQQSLTFKKLKDLYNIDVMPVIKGRHKVVHGFTLKSEHYWKFMEFSGKNNYGVKQLQDEKYNYPDLFREQLSKMYLGFDLMLQLISELPEKKYM